MKSIAAILSLPAVSLAFQHAAINSYSFNRMPSRLNFYPENFERAEKCATHYGICDLEEIEKLANELEQFQSSDLGELQGRDHWKDTKHVEQMLRAQSIFKHMVDDYIGEHHQPETFDMSDV